MVMTGHIVNQRARGGLGRPSAPAPQQGDEGIARLEAKEKEKERFFEIAAQLTRAKDPKEQSRLKEELARLTFGE